MPRGHIPGATRGDVAQAGTAEASATVASGGSLPGAEATADYGHSTHLSADVRRRVQHLLPEHGEPPKFVSTWLNGIVPLLLAL